jgi:hypothetical protein
MVAANSQDDRGLLGDSIAGWADQTGIWEQSQDVAAAPFQYFLGSGTPVDEYGDAPRQQNEQPFYDCAPRGQDVPCVQLSQGPVSSKPNQFLPRSRPEDFVFRETIDKIRCSHWQITG